VVSALVTPGNLRSALAVTRSLGRRRIAVTVADERVGSLAGASRYCRRIVRVPSPARSPEAFVGAIREEVDRGGHSVVIPTDDVTLSLLSQARSQFEGLATLPFPDFETIQTAHDKGALATLASEMGIPIPKTVVVRDPTDFEAAIETVGLPAVVKARMSRFPAGRQWREGGAVRYVRTVSDLAETLRAAGELGPSPLVQEHVSGDGRGIFVLMNRGRLRAAFAHRRIREKPPSGGVSVLSESVALDPQLLAHAERLLEALKWHGVAMLEFKRDSRDGVTKLLEINGRFWGSLQLAVDSGIDFPYLLYRLAVDGEIEPVFAYRERARLRWWLGDVDSLLLRLRERGGPGGRAEALAAFLSPAGRMTKSEVFRMDDPTPAMTELSQYLGSALHGALGRISTRGRRGA
jgi:predicted ATP-grasp superfamily ATP-dependent carboligase